MMFNLLPAKDVTQNISKAKDVMANKKIIKNKDLINGDSTEKFSSALVAVGNIPKKHIHYQYIVISKYQKLTVDNYQL